MSDYNQTFGYTADPECLDAEGEIVGTQDDHAFSFEPDAAFPPIEPTCDERKKGFTCNTPNFIQKFNWVRNAVEKAIHALKTQVDNFVSLTVGLDNQIPFVNGTNDNYEYNTVFFFDHDQTELNAEHYTSNLGVPTSEEFGAGANTNGFTSAVAVGNNAVTTGSSAVVIGAGASAAGLSAVIGPGANGRGTVMGWAATGSTSQVPVCIGGLASVAGSNGIAIGYAANAPSVSCIAIGTSAVAPNQNAIAIGVSSSAAGNQSIAIGSATECSQRGCISIGYGKTAGDIFGQGECVISAEDTRFIWFGNGPRNAAPSDPVIYGVWGEGTDITGGSFRISGGRSTGTAEGGKVVFSTAPAGAVSGVTENTEVDAWQVNADGSYESLIDGQGVILRSPDGLTTKKLTIDNAGALALI